jgi:hypothetical protein
MPDFFDGPGDDNDEEEEDEEDEELDERFGTPGSSLGAIFAGLQGEDEDDEARGLEGCVVFCRINWLCLRGIGADPLR